MRIFFAFLLFRWEICFWGRTHEIGDVERASFFNRFGYPLFELLVLLYVDCNELRFRKFEVEVLLVVVRKGFHFQSDSEHRVFLKKAMELVDEK